MKQKLLFIVCMSLLLTGCYTQFSTLEEKNPPVQQVTYEIDTLTGDTVKVVHSIDTVLKDGTTCYWTRNVWGEPELRCNNSWYSHDWYVYNDYPWWYRSYYYDYSGRCPRYYYYDAGCGCCQYYNDAGYYYGGGMGYDRGGRYNNGGVINQSGGNNSSTSGGGNGYVRRTRSGAVTEQSTAKSSTQSSTQNANVQQVQPNATTQQQMPDNTTIQSPSPQPTNSNPPSGNRGSSGDNGNNRRNPRSW